MTKVNITTEQINFIAYEEIIRTHEKKAKAAIKRDRIKELMAQGIDREMAQVMANAGL